MSPIREGLERNRPDEIDPPTEFHVTRLEYPSSAGLGALIHHLVIPERANAVGGWGAGDLLNEGEAG